MYLALEVPAVPIVLAVAAVRRVPAVPIVLAVPAVPRVPAVPIVLAVPAVPRVPTVQDPSFFSFQISSLIFGMSQKILKAF
jgi:hypothetical protein